MIHRAVMVLVLLLLAASSWRLWLSDDGLREVSRLQSRIDAQHAKNEELRARNAKLTAHVDELKNGTDAIEESARENLGMIGPNETFFQVVDEN
ncbi:MAG: septum formation initiator family protein [Pseudomonadota bacterium]